MNEVIGVRFRLNGKMYYFDPGDLPVRLGSRVIVETSHGIELGKTVMERKSVDELQVIGELRPVVRLATQEDEDHFRDNQEKSRKAYRICQEKIRARNLDMKLISADYSFDNSKLLFFFTADGRVDFRELVRDLASAFHTRIELRQVGIRDEARICGGMGMCGRELCCHAYLSEFAPVSIKMAKEQNLSLNPSKISGVCGRLMCCLKNEEETYEYLNANLPKNGEIVTTFDGITGEVTGVNVLRQTVRLMVTDDDDTREILERKVEEIAGHGRKPKQKPAEQPLPRENEPESKEEESGRVRLRSRGPENSEQEAQGGKNEPRRRDHRGENRFENKKDNRNENRKENRNDHRNDHRSDNRNENRRENKNENRNDNRSDSRQNHHNHHQNHNMKHNGGRPDKGGHPGNNGQPGAGNAQDANRRNNHRRRRKPENNE